ncbi:conserved hypothetical protein [Thermobaculum terrenum ATCC BAA-798]|uniref:GatB/YqeY domain-containing protein n=1 Tax=Thermobaculum terrenum (strain ATCC BAA-798 / CCMEE 7001 / YNP1) TaxID=525904 RepID=D1CB08_THET1|nr:GatB/YqeY domain-containing protein [Thermobaculum terrenum]ACZ41973.1 conserved hypothetical protein [Thermobaculum terrenum ATCC BAA-798]
MSITERLNNDLKEALRSGDDNRKSVIRLLLAALKNQQIENRAPLDYQQELSVLQREAKRRKESIEEYERLGRPDVAEKERRELEIIQSYLPAEMSEEEIRQIVAQAILTTGAQSSKDLGKVMSVVMPQVRGRADGKIVSNLAKEMLENS